MILDLEVEEIEGIPQYFSRRLLSNIQIPREIQYFHKPLGYSAYLMRYGYDQSLYSDIEGEYLPGSLDNLAFRMLTTLFVLKKIQSEVTMTQEDSFNELLFGINRILCDENRQNFNYEILEIPFGSSNNFKSFAFISEQHGFPTDSEIPLISKGDFDILFRNVVGRFISI